MKITVYTVSECQFSKAEKEYLKLNNLSFEEKNLEQNREWLTEMLAVSNNFAGTPVTKIEKDDGTIVVLKGFTKEEFDKELGIGQPPVAQVNAQINIPQPTPSQSQPETPPPSTPATPPVQTTPPQPVSTQPTTTNQPLTGNNPQPTPPQPAPTTNTQPANDPLNSILQDLQTKAQTPSPSPTDLPNIPSFNDKV